MLVLCFSSRERGGGGGDVGDRMARAEKGVVPALDQHTAHATLTHYTATASGNSRT